MARTRKSKGYDVKCPFCGSEDYWPKRTCLGFVPEPPMHEWECPNCKAAYIPADHIVRTDIMTITRY